MTKRTLPAMFWMGIFPAPMAASSWGIPATHKKVSVDGVTIHQTGYLLSFRAELAGRYNKWQTALPPSTVSSELQVDFTRILLISSTSDSSRRGFAAL